jgi:hypothetical protein
LFASYFPYKYVLWSTDRSSGLSPLKTAVSQKRGSLTDELAFTEFKDFFNDSLLNFPRDICRFLASMEALTFRSLGSMMVVRFIFSSLKAYVFIIDPP